MKRITSEIVQRGLDKSKTRLFRNNYVGFNSNNDQCVCPATAVLLGTGNYTFYKILWKDWEDEDGRVISTDELYQLIFGKYYITGFVRAIDDNSFLDEHDSDYGSNKISEDFRQGYWDGVVINENFDIER